MSVSLLEPSQWASGLGARLRLLQASFADDDDALRRDYLEEEIERELQSVPPSRKKEYLDALAARFPEGEGATAQVVDLIPAADADTPSVTPEGLTAQLIALSDSMTEQQRREIGLRLQAAGFAVAVAVQTPAETDEVPAELQKKLGLSPDQTLDRKRAIRLVSALIDLVVTMDQVSWQVWKSIAPNSRVRRDPGAAGDLRKIAGPFLVGDSEVSTAQVLQLLDKSRQLVAGLVAAVGSAGEVFARQYLTRFSPQNIKEAADAEPGFFVGPEQKCWRKYTQLFNEMTGTVIESEIANAIAKRAEDLILGAERAAANPASGARY
jgi:peptidoglycan hydrolase-like protein with peptidoglycan-binding domain